MLALPILISVMSSVYVPFHSMYKAATSYDNHYGYGRSDYDDDYENFDSWENSDYYKSWDRENREEEGAQQETEE